MDGIKNKYMTNTTKIIFISLGVVGCGVAIWYFFFRDDKNGKQFPDVDDLSKDEKDEWEHTNSGCYTSEGNPLKMCSKGNNVECLQKVLNVKGCKDKNGSGLTVDGKFGPLTESALEGCGKGKSITLSSLKTMMQNQINKGLVVDCSGSSCCSDMIAYNDDKDNDGIPDSIDIDGGDGTGNPVSGDPPYNPYQPPYPVIPYAIQDTTDPNNIFAFSGELWFDKKNNEY